MEGIANLNRPGLKRQLAVVEKPHIELGLDGLRGYARLKYFGNPMSRPVLENRIYSGSGSRMRL